MCRKGFAVQFIKKRQFRTKYCFLNFTLLYRYRKKGLSSAAFGAGEEKNRNGTIGLKYSEIISKMTIEEKEALMSGRDFWSTTEYEKYGIPSAFLSDGLMAFASRRRLFFIRMNASAPRPKKYNEE